MDQIANDVQLRLCRHCNSAVPSNRTGLFCCSGCRSVFELLHRFKLDRYYELKSGSSSLRSAAPVRPMREIEPRKDLFAYLDSDHFKSELNISSVNPRLQFYLEGVHCTACLWLIEKLPEVLSEDVKSARLNLHTSVVEIFFQSGGKISNVARHLDELGYRPHPLTSETQGKEIAHLESRRFLSRLAVAGAFTGNIMIFSVSIYAGATGFIKNHFDLLILLLALPVFTYSAVPLYQNCINSFKTKRWSVDVPIVIALLSGFIISTISVFTHKNQNYLDSLSGLIFFLLCSRYYLMSLQKNAFGKLQFFDSFFPVQVKRVDGSLAWPKDLIAGDEIQVQAGQRIPVDGLVVEGSSSIDQAIMSGEALPIRVSEHSDVYAGTINLESALQIRVTSTGAGTRIGKIAQELQSFRVNDSSTVRSSEKVARAFTISVMLWAGIVFLYFIFEKNLPLAGLERVLTILIVSCPCAFALAAPLAHIRAYQKLIKCGMFLKNPNTIENVANIRSVAFDKTGTLTEGLLDVTRCEWSGNYSIKEKDEIFNVILTLEKDEAHPVAKALCRYARIHVNTPREMTFSNLRSLSGRGVSGVFDGRKFEIKSGVNRSCISVYRGEIEIVRFWLFDNVKKDARYLIDRLKEKSYDSYILSGDSNDQSIEELALALNIPSERVLYGLTPEEKAKWIGGRPNTLYIGDGANDGLALKKAAIGIAVHGALDISMKASDGYLIFNRLGSIADLFIVSEETRKILQRHLIFTVLYNGFTISVATLGMLTPLIAAVLMPLSSILILFSTQMGTRELRRLG